jgi:flagellar protein FliO/FliZ
MTASTSGTWTAVLWFMAIVAMIPLALWVLKRTPMGGAHSGPGTPRTVAVMPLSAQQRLVTVEVGQGDERLWLVLGVTPHGIRTLHTMAPQTAAPAEVPPPPAAAFAQLLGRLRGSAGLGDPGTPGDRGRGH